MMTARLQRRDWTDGIQIIATAAAWRTRSGDSAGVVRGSSPG
jgi:hypothetical protein